MARVDKTMFSITYCSAATPGFDSLDLAELLSEARAKNRINGVTGMLLAENGRFLQALEGPEATVRGVMAMIEGDPRHQQVRILAEERIAGRRFPDWAMAQGHLGAVEAKPLAEYSEVLVAARRELPEPPTRLQSIGRWFRSDPRRPD